jgi:biopolymer transport protein ExbD
VIPCDSNAIMGSRSAPVRSFATRTEAITGTARQTSVSLSSANGVTHYFVDGAEVPLEQLGEAAAQAWLANTPGGSIEECWRGTAPGAYTIAGRETSLCRIAIIADEDVSYGRFAFARDALRDAGFITLALLSPDQTSVVRDDHLPLNPVPVALQGISPTTVRIAMPPDATEPVITIANGQDFVATTFPELRDDLTLQAARNNPALTTEELYTTARVCIRPYSNVSYGDVMHVLTFIRDLGFARAGLYSEAVVAVDDQGRRRH